MLCAKSHKVKKRKAAASGIREGRSASKTKACTERLTAGAFRHINKLLYSQTSEESAALMTDPGHQDYAEIYHRGYNEQAQTWPIHPLTQISSIIRDHLSSATQVDSEARPVIVDMGAGSCQLATSLAEYPVSVISVEFAPTRSVVKKWPRRLTSSEYLEQGGLMTTTMKKVKLPDGCADIVVFSLSLMGTDWPSCLAEGSRLARTDGLIIIAEVASRFKSVKSLIKKLEKCGLSVRKTEFLDDGYFFVLTMLRKSVLNEWEFEKLGE